MHPCPLTLYQLVCLYLKFSFLLATVGNVAANRRRQHAVTVGKERREALVRTKRLCRVGVSGDDIAPPDSDMMIDVEESVLEVQTSSAVEELKFTISFQ